ncbi:MAG: leucine-rich repeat domain-containing protein, partial [Ruminococcaceae bacterium]|nr:leucine-rich repeat domain-containing protein [Oscillospiraceae bacterium]
MAKRVCSVFLALALCLTLLPTAARAAVVDSGYCGGEGDGTNLSWTLDDQGTLTISGTGKMADYWYDSPFYDSDAVKKVVIKKGVTSIGDWAFYYCSSLTSVSIPNSVTSIGDNAFYD